MSWSRPEVLPRHPVVEDEDARVLILADGCHRLHGCEAELPHHLVDDKEKGCEHTESLKGVGPHQCLDASLACIEPDKQHHRRHCEPEGNTDAIEHEALKDEAHHEETHGGSRHLRQQEEGCPRLIGTVTKPVEQIGVDGGEVVPIVDRQQDESHQEIPHDEAQAHLQVSHAALHRHARYTDEGDARDGSSHHAESHHVPR